MKKSKILLAVFIVLTTIFSVIPSAFSQKGTYQFHAEADDQKILKVTTVNSASLTDLYGANWTEIIEIFGIGAASFNARSKSVVLGANFDSSHFVDGAGLFDAASIITLEWFWTTEPFDESYDMLKGIQSLYDPTAINTICNANWSANATMVNASIYFGQLPTPVDQYLGAIVWEDNWEVSGYTVIHQAKIGESIFSTDYLYLENCTETWTFDGTNGVWIGYKLQDNETNTIYEISIELPSPPTTPGFELPVVISAIAIGVISIIYAIMRKKKL
ncbi:MAG: hypothetical protein ACW98X_00955 [Promethearchaeota archaeon]|jgi:hypothetical protein